MRNGEEQKARIRKEEGVESEYMIIVERYNIDQVFEVNGRGANKVPIVRSELERFEALGYGLSAGGRVRVP